MLHGYHGTSVDLNLESTRGKPTTCLYEATMFLEISMVKSAIVCYPAFHAFFDLRIYMGVKIIVRFERLNIH
jgi:hypothetical protein